MRNDSGRYQNSRRALSDASPLRKIIDPIAPYGSARREALKALGRT